MIALKKMYGDELLRLALVLSLLKADPNDYLQAETQQIMAGLHRANGTDWSIEQEARTLIRPTQIHPKSLDNILMNYERQLFEELNSLGRYNGNNGRMSSLHTYLVNNVATETVGQSLPDTVEDDVVSDDNVAQEVKIAENDNEEETPDAVVTLSADFFSNRSESDIFADIATRSFDVEELLNEPHMMIKEEPQEEFDLAVKVERDDLFSDNAMDDFVPYFAERSKMEIADPESVLDQNIADLQDYEEILEEAKALRDDFEHLEVKENKDLEKFLLENTPLESPYELTPMFEEDLVVEVKRERASTSFTASSSGVSEMDASGDEREVKIEPDEGHHSGDELTQEDMDLIEVLWKQDVDMGFCVDSPVVPGAPQATKVATDDLDSELKRTQEKILEEKKGEKAKEKGEGRKEDDPWAGLSYTVDTETGEYVLLGDLPGELVNSEESRFDLLEEALNLVDLGDDSPKNDEPPAVEGGSGSDDMLHPAMARHAMPPHHPLAHYHNQRWQDLASLLTIPPPPEQYQYHHHHHHHQQHPHNVSSHSAAASYAPSYGPLPPPVPEKHPDHYGAPAPLDGAYKLESAHHPQQHDGLYYQQSGPEMAAGNSDGFLQSILNDEDLQLMDMAMNEGMYTMRVLDGGGAPPAPHPAHSTHHMMMTAERDSASDSAVSSMGSERVPSLSDGEWCDAGSDSAQEYHSSKFRPYDSAAYRDRAPPPQKKHHMFGKRCFQEAPPHTTELTPREHIVKYECPEQAAYENMHMQGVEFGPRPLPHPVPLQPTMDIHGPHSSHALLQGGARALPPPARPLLAPDRVRHNHTYSDTRPRARDKRVRHLTEESLDGSPPGHLSRDEKRAKALGIPLEVQDIINLPMDEFNERLSKHDLSEAQLSLIRDIRRRGKNKVAAQNCRKRKLDQISSLADEVRTMRDRKQRTQREHAQLQAERQRVKERFAALYRHVFQSLRDTEGRPLSSAQYSLQQAADGNVVLVPRMQHRDSMNRTSDDEMDRKAKSYDQ